MKRLYLNNYPITEAQAALKLELQKQLLVNRQIDQVTTDTEEFITIVKGIQTLHLLAKANTNQLLNLKNNTLKQENHLLFKKKEDDEHVYSTLSIGDAS